MVFIFYNIYSTSRRAAPLHVTSVSVQHQTSTVRETPPLATTASLISLIFSLSPCVLSYVVHDRAEW